METVSEQKHSLGVITLVCNPEGPQIDSHEEPVTFCHVHISKFIFFGVMQILCSEQKIKNNLKHFCDCKMTLQSIESTTFVSPNGWEYHCATGVLSVWRFLRNFVIYRGDWLSIKFCENDSFRKLFMFFENTFQYLGGISQDISVSHFDSHRSLNSANRRRSTSPILFISFTQPCDQHDRKIRMISKSAARWHGRRARGYWKLILRANLLYVSHFKMKRRLRSRSAHNFFTCA